MCKVTPISVLVLSLALLPLRGSAQQILLTPHQRNVLNSKFINEASSASPERLKAILAQGAQIEGKGPDGETALMQAARNGKIENVKTLISLGAKIEFAGLVEHAFGYTFDL